MTSNAKPWVKYVELDKNVGKFVIAPLRKGMGVTIGNSIRRVLLSSLSGAAVTSLRINGVKHEYTTIPNVKEDVLDIISNIKSTIFQLDTEESQVLTLKYEGVGKVTAANIEKVAGVKIINPSQYIAELTEKDKLEIEMIVEKGVGYVSSDANKQVEEVVDTIYVDSSFSPVLRVNHQVESARVGKSLDYDSLVLTVWTNGSVNPEDTVRSAADLLVQKFGLFSAINVQPEEDLVDVEEKDENSKESVLKMTIDDLEFSARSANCLKRAGIETVAELVEKDLSELMKIKNFGKKSSDEIDLKLSQFGLALKT